MLLRAPNAVVELFIQRVIGHRGTQIELLIHNVPHGPRDRQDAVYSKTELNKQNNAAIKEI